MKRILILAIAALALVGLSGCKNETPRFDISVEAVVLDTTNYFHGAANLAVRNVEAGALCAEAVPYAQAGRDGRKAEKFVNRQVKKYVKANIPNDKPYWQVHVKGYVKYIVTVEIDKTFPE